MGIGTWLLVMFAGSAAVKPGEDFEEPMMMVIGLPFYAIFANLACTAGPLLDTRVYRGTPRKHLLKAGYIFSLVLTALPGVWALAAWLWTVATGTKLNEAQFLSKRTLFAYRAMKYGYARVSTDAATGPAAMVGRNSPSHLARSGHSAESHPHQILHPRLSAFIPAPTPSNPPESRMN